MVKFWAVMVCAGIVRGSVFPVAVTSAILIYPVFPLVVAASMYSELKSPVFMMTSLYATEAAAFPAWPVVLLMRCHQLLLFGGTIATGLSVSKYVQR